MKYQADKRVQYQAQVHRIDALLDRLYQYIETHYNEDEYIISLFSDHGQSFLNKHFAFSDQRTHIPMMLRGRNIPTGYCEEFVQPMDLFPIILHCVNEENEIAVHDGNLPKWFGGAEKRPYALSESLYPNASYKCIFYEKSLSIHFISEENMTKDGRLPFCNYYTYVFDLQTGEDVTEQHTDKIETYQKIVHQRLSDYYI